MTEDEKLWCLDGDAPFWAGPRLHGPWRLSQEPVLRGSGRAARAAGLRVQRRTAWRCRRPRDVLPGEHGPGRDVGPRPRRAHRRRDRARAPGDRRGPVRRGVRQHPATPRMGPGPGDLRRGPASRRRDGRRADPRHPASRDGVREALRVQLDGERSVPGRHRGRRGRVARGLPARTSSGSSTRASPS